MHKNIKYFIIRKNSREENEYSEDNVFCPVTVTVPSPSRHRPVPVLSNAVPFAFPLRSKGLAFI